MLEREIGLHKCANNTVVLHSVQSGWMFAPCRTIRSLVVFASPTRAGCFTFCSVIRSLMLCTSCRLDASHSLVIAWALLALGYQLQNPTNPLPYETPKEYTRALSYNAFAFSLVSFCAGVCGCGWVSVKAFLDWRRGGRMGGRSKEGSSGDSGLLGDQDIP